MRAIITGGTGVIGRVLVDELAAAGHEVIVLSRNPDNKAGMFPDGVQVIGWDAKSAQGWGAWVNGETAIINLAGENVANWRWTDEHRRRVLQSRLDTSQAVVEAIEQASEKPRVLLQASAVGFYGDQGDTVLTEDSPLGSGWRAEVVDQWEAASEAVKALGVRRVLLRIGIVIDTAGGALPPMVLGARFMGGQLGNGRQWIPWVHNLDVARAIAHLMTQDDAAGVMNIVAPEPVTNKTMMHTIGKVIRWPTFIPVPGFALKLALGEMATSVLDSQRVEPPALLASGYDFAYPKIEPALRDILK